VFYCYTPQELHVLQSQNAAPCSIITLPRNCTFCRLRKQHRVLLLHSPGTARTEFSERSTVFYCYTPQELHVLHSQNAAPCSIVTLSRNCTYCSLRTQHRVLLLHSPGTARTAFSERSTVFYCYTPQELLVLQAQNAATCSIVTLPRNCTYCKLRAQHRVLLLHSPGTARTAVSERSTVFYCYTPQELHVLQSQSAAPCSIVTLLRNCTYCSLRTQHRVQLLHSPGTARTAVSERSTVFYFYTPQKLHVLQSQSATPCSIVTLPRNCTYCSLRTQHRILFLHSPGTARTAVSERSTVFYFYTPQELHVMHSQNAVPCSIVTLPRNYTYCRLRSQHPLLQHHVVILLRT